MPILFKQQVDSEVYLLILGNPEVPHSNDKHQQQIQVQRVYELGVRLYLFQPLQGLGGSKAKFCLESSSGLKIVDRRGLIRLVIGHIDLD